MSTRMAQTVTARVLALAAMAGALVACSPSGEDIPDEAASLPAEEAPAAAPTPDWPALLRAELTVTTPPDRTELVTALTGDIQPATHPGFTSIPLGLATREGMYGRSEAVLALSRMQEAAAADGVQLVVLSAFRSLGDQQRIWNNKWTGVTAVEGAALPDTTPEPTDRARKILEYSSMPTTSRHHWGTDFDLNNLNNSWFETDEGARVHDWLSQNAAAFGFCQVYSEKGPDRPHGYEMEKWHWSYMPLASKFLAAYPDLVSYTNITGFEGEQVARAIDVIGVYVQGIEPGCSARWPPDQPMTAQPSVRPDQH